MLHVCIRCGSCGRCRKKKKKEKKMKVKVKKKKRKDIGGSKIFRQRRGGEVGREGVS